MMKNKQGMSAVVTTLIIILLVIVALGIIWVVVKNVIQGGVEQVDLSTKCREVEVQAVALVANSPTSYDLTLKRLGSGDEIGGVRLVFFNTTTNTNSEVVDFGYALEPLETHTETITIVDAVTGANKIDMTVFFVSDLGETEFCPITVTKEF